LDFALRDFKFELPGTAATRLHVNANHVRDPTAALQTLLAALASAPTRQSPLESQRASDFES
jgi:hypothetical protein